MSPSGSELGTDGLAGGSRSRSGGDSVHRDRGLGGDDLVNIQQRLDGALDLGHAEDVVGVELRAEVRRLLDVRLRNV